MSQRSGKKKESGSKRAGALIALHGLLLVYSLSGIFSKNASAHPPISFEFCLFYLGTLVVLGIYAVGWQQVLKHLPLTVAFANKAVTIIWSMLWGVVLFSESVNLTMLIGAAIVIVGVVLYSYADANEEKGDASSQPLGVEEAEL